MARRGEPLGAGTELATMLGGGGMGRSRATIAAACGVALMVTGTHASEHHFWYNVITGETVAVSPLPTKHADPVSGSDYWAMPDGSTQWNRPTEMAWYKTEHQAKVRHPAGRERSLSLPRATPAQRTRTRCRR